ncbi:phosphocarrier protein HPr [Lentilactobacillus kefiri]|uniref:Phosphocarrier protein HPr n=2 Tax=Lentilactobacillus kefiri TaxID=33962 RepID=A0A511DYR0_LENKE|nr:phosphocarrier protein HPr [Lentilactobacillus kefiri]MCJ2162511.1 phosphocarrier protein HPr [Lentilactobacillus kefiri]MCP9369510.1 phosphocarrier protein HPr [Lentilactobacillus kefiri]MDH5109092.1 phosphocarrier protein HPr [Lentilactobacillus kefiri]MDM7493465.1 phosphocarrier protein HPr [Lentilactobacillus kefiri]PAK80861.1 phosphocarrier protein HPr [Lentilactobacillus kefiri]
MEINRFKVLAETGIMSRPATRLVIAAQNYVSNVRLTYNGKTVNLKSIMGVMSLGIPQGSYIQISTSGDDEQEAMAGIVEYLQDGHVVEQVELDAS